MERRWANIGKYDISGKGTYIFSAVLNDKTYEFKINVDRYEIIGKEYDNEAVVYDFDENKFLNIDSAKITVKGIEEDIPTDNITINEDNIYTVNYSDYFEYEGEEPIKKMQTKCGNIIVNGNVEGHFVN